MKLPPFIATLGTMLLARGLSAIIVSVPNIFYPSLTDFNRLFSNSDGFPTGALWVIVFTVICMYLMYKNKVGRYILAIGSNEEATRLSGINTDKYKMMAYILSGLGAGIAAIFWAASFPTVAAATGNGMELDAIAGVYIGGTSAAGGVASVFGSVTGSLLLVVIRSGLNMALARFNLNVNATYVTYVLTGIIVVAAVLIDVVKNKRASRGGARREIKTIKAQYRELIQQQLRLQDELISRRDITSDEFEQKNGEILKKIGMLKQEREDKINQISSRKQHV
jgi:ribose transport system permease protein